MHMSICTLCEKSSVRAAEKRFIQLSNRKNIVTTTRAENLATGNASDRSGLHSAPALFAGVVAKHLRLNAKMLSIVVMPAVRNPTARALRINQQQTDILSIYHNRNDSTTTADVIILETSYLEAAKPELEKYDVLTKQIKAAIKTRKELQAEKKATPILNVLKHRELTSRIEDLTEQLEDLRSERAIILMYLDCEESRDTAEVKKRCTAAETMLEKLEVSEAKYSYALDDAKNAFADLQEQAKDLDAGELYEARLAIRNEKE